MAKTDLTAQRLRELLHYDPETGVFTRLTRTSNSVRVGTVAGTAHKDGMIHIFVMGSVYKAHRLAWLYMTGEWPKNEIDHIDGNNANNAIANLRDVSRRMNQENQRVARKNNVSGLIGVMRNHKRWAAQIRTNGTRICIGTFDTKEQAHEAYIQAKRMLHEGCTI